MKKSNLILILAAVSLALPACSKGAKKTLGLERVKPDEFAVYKRAPLTLPPDYNLRPPKPGTPRPQESNSADRAKELIASNKTSTSTPKPSSTLGEISLLRKAGVTEANPDIRSILREEYGEVPEVEQGTASVVEKILGKETTVDGKTLNPMEEAKDLNEKGVKAPVPITQPQTKP